MNKNTMRRAALGVLLVATLAGCGGGSGDGGQASAAAGVSVQTTAMRGNTGDGVRGYPVYDIVVEGTASGKLDALEGQTLYLRLSGDVNGLYDPVPSVDYVFDNGDFQFTIRADKHDVQAGEYKGTLEVAVCLDANCAHPLGGSPLQVPYDLKMHEVLSVPTSPLAFQTSFGTTLPPVDVPITLPEGMDAAFPNSSVTSGPDGFTDPLALQVIPANDGSNKGVLRIQPSDAGVGNWTIRVWVDAYGDYTGQSSHSMSDAIEVTYTVTPDASKGLWIVPPEGLKFSLAQGRQEVFWALPYWTWTFSEAVTDWHAAYIYTAAPEAAAGMPLASNWFQTVPSFGAADCDAEGHCLPPGDYTVIMRTSYEKSGQSFTMDYPITMTVTP